MKRFAECKIPISNERCLEILFTSLGPEFKKPVTTRSKAKLERDCAFLVLTVEARDTVALRAALNAYLRWIRSIMEVLNFLEKTGNPDE